MDGVTSAKSSLWTVPLAGIALLDSSSIQSEELQLNPAHATHNLRTEWHIVTRMTLYHKNAEKTDPRNTESWRYACQDCGTPFKSNVNTCLDCGDHDIAPIELVTGTNNK